VLTLIVDVGDLAFDNFVAIVADGYVYLLILVILIVVEAQDFAVDE
jgi:hypothetical protein